MPHLYPHPTIPDAFLGTINMQPVLFSNNILTNYITNVVLPHSYKVLKTTVGITLLPYIPTTQYYKLLNISTPCSTAAVKAAYRACCLTMHPDKGGCEVTYKAMRKEYKEATGNSYK